MSETMSLAPTWGMAGSGSARGMSPTTSTPWLDSPRIADTAIASTSTSSVHGIAGARRRPTRSTASDAPPTASVVTSTSPRSPRRSHSRRKKLPSPGSTPRRLGSCARAIVRPSPNRNPVITGLDTRSATAPKPREATEDEHDARHEREHCRQRRELAGIPACERADRRGRHRVRRGRRAHDQLVRRAEQAVADHRHGRRHEPGLGRQAGDLRVRDRLRRHDAQMTTPAIRSGRSQSRR